MNEHLAEFIASSFLTVIMTYANWRLSAEMRQKRDAATNQGWMKGGGKQGWKDKLCIYPTFASIW